jgi:hypothetical protein
MVLRLWGRLATCDGLAIRLPQLAAKLPMGAGSLRIARADSQSAAD